MIPRFVIPLIAAAAFVAPALAQPQPGQPQPGQQPPRRPQPQQNQDHGPGQPQPNPPTPGGERAWNDGARFVDVPMQLRLVTGYLGLIDQFNDLAQDPTASGIAAVLGANEILKPRGADAVIEYFSKLLPETKNEAVQRAIRLQLVEAYKSSNQHDKALSELQALITGTPASAGSAKPE